MKSLLVIFTSIAFSTTLSAQNNVGIGTTSPNNSAALDITSTSKGILVPRMNSTQRILISSPATGLLVFDTDTESFWFKNATGWTELVDNANNGFKKNGTIVYTTGNTQVGIGTSTPLYDLHIKQQNASIGLQDAATNRISATFTASDSNVIINAFRGGSAGGDIILQRSSTVPAAFAGNVGIGVPFTSSPQEKLQVNGNLRLQSTTAKLAFHNGADEEGRLQLSGNDLRLETAPGNLGRLVFGTQGATQVAISATGKLQRPNVTGSSNLLPLAYGRVASNGVVLGSTGNFSVQKVAGVEGEYKITLSGESNVYMNRNSYAIFITCYNDASLTSRAMLADVGILADNTLEVRLTRPRTFYVNDACANQCGPFSYITRFTQFWDEIDGEFSIMVYKH